MTLGGAEFVRRQSLHVLPQGFTKIRRYGLLGNNRRTKILPVAREALERSRWHHLDRTPPSPVTEEPERHHRARTLRHSVLFLAIGSGFSQPLLLRKR